MALSGSRFTETDESNLAAHADIEGRLYCRHACGLCEPHCPSRVPVNTIMRYNHYFVAQGREKYAMKKYAELDGQRADACRNCKGFCQAACPYDVPVNDLLTFAHSNLSLV